MTLHIAVPLLALSTLYDQSAERLLRSRVAAPNVSYIVIAAEDGRSVASRWPGADKPIPVGSLVKPFVATAIPENTRRRCRPEKCWQPQGHGEIGLVEAIGHSCNSYFLQAAAEIDPEAIAGVAAIYGLARPADLSPKTLAGFGANWAMRPLALIEAYRTLVAEHPRPEILQGMRLSAAEGTARLLGMDALAKTGTAPCSHASRAAGDGFVFAAWPADRPRYLVLVRVHNTTGANAARTAGEVLRALRDGR